MGVCDVLAIHDACIIHSSFSSHLWLFCLLPIYFLCMFVGMYKFYELIQL